jgi:long-chain acyl-CoA synthetase
MNSSSNIVELIRLAAATRLAAPAVIEGTLVLSYGELLAAIDGFAVALAGVGIKPGQRIAYLGEDSAGHIVATLAILRLGAVVVPISSSLAGDEADAVLERIDAHGLLCDAGIPRPDQPAAELPSPVSGGRPLGWRPRTPHRPDPPGYAGMNAAFIRFSSGTTGVSKGVLLSHQTIIERTDLADQALRITEADRVLWLLPMSYHFVVTILLFLRRGASIILCNQAFPESLLEAQAAWHGTFLYASPFQHHVLASTAIVPATALADVRMAVSTTMKLPGETARAFQAKFGLELSEAYGIIEVGLPFVSLHSEGGARGSVGRPLPGYELRIENPDAAGTGSILLRGPGVFDAYFSPWQPRAEACPDGWFHTGDLGYCDAEGRLVIAGREKNVINFVGMKIFPEEIEEVINQFPGIKESLVYGTPHPNYGQLPCVKIVPADPAAGVDMAGLRRFCISRLAPHKVPKAFDLVPALERTPSGKLRRK